MSHPSNPSSSTDQLGDHNDSEGKRGHTTFHVTYDDTGAVVAVEAPNGWRIREVVAEGYRLLGESPRTGDRIEANATDMAPYMELHVKEFVQRRIAPDLNLNVVSNTGGACSPPSVA